MADFHQPRFVPTIHALGDRRLSTAEVARAARGIGKSVTLVLPALAAEVDGRAFPRMLGMLAGCPLLDRLVVVLGCATREQHRRAEALLSEMRMPVTLVRLDGQGVRRINRHIDASGLAIRPVGKGYACWVGLCAALTTPGSDVIAMHDCDIVTYHPSMLARLVAPLVVPEQPFDFAKGYYPRVTSTLYGRVTRLLVTPLLQAVQQVGVHSTLPAFLADFRYPLAGEVAFSRRLAERLPLHVGWGLEIGTLAEVFRRRHTIKACQVDIADTYDHRHRALTGGPDGGDLAAMTGEVVMALVRALRCEQAACDTPTLHRVLDHYRREAARCVDVYAADAAVNGLSYDRAQEERAILAFHDALEQRIRGGLTIEVPPLPSWWELQETAPGLCGMFADLAVASELEGASSPVSAGAVPRVESPYVQ